MKRYALNILIAIDQLLNALAGGDPDETISSRCGKRVDRCVLCRWLCAALDRLNPAHCKRAIEMDEGKDEVWG